MRRKNLRLNQDTLKWLWQAKSQSPQRHPFLPPELTAKAKAVWERVRPHWATTFEPFEFQLTKDEQPEQEIAMWEKIADAFGSYMASHPAADRAWVQDILCMVSLGMAATNKMPLERRRMFRELRRLYLRCGGTITPLMFSSAPPQLAPETTSYNPQALPAMQLEDVAPVDVMTSDWIIVRDRQTRQCYVLYPQEVPSRADLSDEDLNRQVTTLVIEFDQDNDHHHQLIENILKIAKGEV